MAIFGDDKQEKEEGAGNDGLPNPDDDPRAMAMDDFIAAVHDKDRAGALMALDRIYMDMEPEGDEMPMGPDLEL